MDEAKGVWIDEDFIRIGTKSIAIDKISSIDVRTRFVHGPALLMLLGICAFFAAMIGLGSGSAGAYWVAAAFALLTFVRWRQMKAIEHILLLTTSSQEIAALKSSDGPFVQGIREKIEREIASRARR